MATKLHTTAEIIPFPVSRRGRDASEMAFKSRQMSNDAHNIAAIFPAGYQPVECGSAWYHDDAMSEANLSR